MTAIPRPSTKRPTTNWAILLEVEMMIMPVIMTAPPTNMPFLRPYLSERTAANGAPTMAPTVYREKMTETVEPVVPLWKVSWKCFMARIEVMREPS